MRCRTHVMRTLALSVVMACATAGLVAQMPDPRQMSGVPLPVGDVAPGTVTVRVIRGSFANPISSQTVELVGAGDPKQASTNDIGRAEFSGVKIGARVKAFAVIAGERVESQEFTVPTTGGIRLILVAPDGGGAPAASGASAPDAGAAPPAAAPSAPSGPAQPGTVTLGDDSRFVFEAGEDGLNVFYVLQVMNTGQAPVQTAPIVFDLPNDARSAALLEGSSKQAVVAGRRLTINGPFAPGPTIVQLAYSMPYSGATLDIRQNLPLALGHVAVVAQKIGEMELSSPQMSEQRTMPAQGNLYIAGRGGAVAAGTTLEFKFSKMPHSATWPRNVALALAVLILVGGAWSAVRASSRSGQDAERRRLTTERERLFDELAALEVSHREERIDAQRFADRRRELVAALERVYLALDEGGAMERAS